MMHDNMWNWGMGGGAWLIPFAFALIIVFAIRYRRKK